MSESTTSERNCASASSAICARRRSSIPPRSSASVSNALDELFRHVGLDRSDLEGRPVRQIRPCLHRKRRGELPVLALRAWELEVVLRLCHRAYASLRGGVPEPAADMALDRLAQQALT